MKKIIILLAAALVFSACLQYDALPEPLLPLVEINFSSAAYSPGVDPKIVLTLGPSVSYDGIYSFYNRESKLNMERYLKSRNISIKSTEVTKPASNITSITMVLKAPITPPLTLTFDTKEPMYLYNDRGWGQNVIEAKAFIATPTVHVP